MFRSLVVGGETKLLVRNSRPLVTVGVIVLARAICEREALAALVVRLALVPAPDAIVVVVT